MHKHIHTHTYTYARTHTHTYIYTHTHTHTHTNTHTHTHTHAHAHAHTHTHAHTRTQACTHAPVCMRGLDKHTVCVYACVHTCVSTCVLILSLLMAHFILPSTTWKMLELCSWNLAVNFLTTVRSQLSCSQLLIVCNLEFMILASGCWLLPTLTVYYFTTQSNHCFTSETSPA